MVVADRGFVLCSIKIVMRPKSVRRAVPLLSTRMFACSVGQRDKRCVVGTRKPYPLEIPVNNLELVKVCHTRRDLGQLEVGGRQRRVGVGAIVKHTSRKRFASVFFLAYSITFPLGIHSVRIRKQYGSVEAEIPSRGRIFGWDKCLHPMISRHNRWGKMNNGGAGGPLKLP